MDLLGCLSAVKNLRNIAHSSVPNVIEEDRESLSAATTTSDTVKRLRSLDILRGIAATLVLIRHAPYTADDNFTAIGRVFHFFQTVGWVGVDLFFVLSGFLISSVLLRELDRTGTIRLKRFWLRRGLKIWPSYYVAYGGVWFLGCVWALRQNADEKLHKLLRDAVPNALFIQNYVSCERWPHSWTLAIEEHFYLLLPIFLLLPALYVRRRFSVRFITGLWLAFSIAIMSLRYQNLLQGDRWTTNYYQSHLRVDSLMFGVFLCWLLRRIPISDKKVRLLGLISVPVVCSGLVLAYSFPLSATSFSVWGFTYLYIASGLVTVLAWCRPNVGESLRGLPSYALNGCAWLGTYSYTIYLAHSVIFPIPGAATTFSLLSRQLTSYGFSIEIAGFAQNVLFISLSIVGGYLLSYLVERPLLRRRSVWCP